MKNYIVIILISLLLLLQGCSGCSNSGKRREQLKSTSDKINNDTFRSTKDKFSGKTIVSMTKEGGVYRVPVTINGAEMLFIFDTGASLISISNVEASYLYKQGTLTIDDVLDKANFVDANGDISPGVIINLKNVKIGDRTIHNVKASVVNNSKAPLLFGQSALEEFGNFSINYVTSTITFDN